MLDNLNLTELILKTINELFGNLFSSIDNSLYSVLDSIVFIDSTITKNNSFANIIGTNSTEGLILICNSLVLGFIIYFSINYLLSHLIYSNSETPKQFIFKSIIFIAIMNSSLWICEEIIFINSVITQAISSIGLKLFHTEINFSNFINHINQNIYLNSTDFSIISFDGIIKSFSTFGLLNLVFTYSLRYIMVQTFVLISPFAFISLLNSKTSFFFNVWLKTFISLLLMQVLLSIILLLSFTIDISSSVPLSKLLFIGVIYALLRTNTYIKELFGGISTEVSSSLFLRNFN